MTDTSQPPRDRQLVTFALFAYNQEKYIREAVEGAFAQTYEPLEIILSDDCSSDRTYEIIQEMAAAYDGPHEVTVLRNSINAGLSEHINIVASIVRGSIVVLAAGDDVSSPLRAEAHVQVYQKHKESFAVFSDYSAFPDSTSKKYHFIKSRFYTDTEIIYNGGGVQIGATYSYRKECLTWPGPLPRWLTSEDRLLPFRAALLGKVRYTSENLVAYRVSDVPNEVEVRSSRILGLNNSGHFRQLYLEFREAAWQGKINLRKRINIWMILRARAYQLSLVRNKFLPEKLIDLIFSPLRIARKSAVLFELRKEDSFRERVDE